MVTELVFDNATSVSNVLRRYWGSKHKSFLNIWQGPSPGHLIAGNQEGSNGDVSS